MMGLPAHRFLEEFALDVTAFPAAIAGLRRQSERRLPPAGEAAADEVAVRIQAAYAQGYAAGEDAERAAGEARLAELAADAERKMAEAETAFGRGLADRLSRDLVAEIGLARERFAAQIASVLLPILRRRMTEDCVSDLARQAAGILGAGDTIVVDLRGPETLVEMVLAAVEALQTGDAPSLRSRFRCHVAEGSEVSVAYADSVIEARLGEWLARLDASRAP